MQCLGRNLGSAQAPAPVWKGYMTLLHTHGAQANKGRGWARNNQSERTNHISYLSTGWLFPLTPKIQYLTGALLPCITGMAWQAKEDLVRMSRKSFVHISVKRDQW